MKPGKAEAPPGFMLLLGEVVNRRLEHTVIVVAADIDIQRTLVSDALTVTHLAEHAAIGGSDALDRIDGAIGIEHQIHRGNASVVAVLSCNLTIGGQLRNQLGRSDELALAMRDGTGINIAGIGVHQPRRLIGSYTSAYQTGLMARDIVEGQRCFTILSRADLAIGYQTQLDQRLETIADTADQTITLAQQLMHTVSDHGIAEERSDELTGTIGLIAAGEAAGNEDDLAACNRICESLDGLGNCGSSQIADDHDLRLSAGNQECALRIELTVGAGEHRISTWGLAIFAAGFTRVSAA